MNTQIDHPVIAPLDARAPSLRDADGLDAVERLMTRLSVGTRLERAGLMVQEHLASGGKRLRARLALATVEALGASRTDGVGWAAAVELLHNASLVHDDIQDGDRVRRGEPTLWVRHGIGQALNAGDLMLMLPTLAIEHASIDDGIRWRLARTLAAHAAETVRGQSEEMALLASRRFDGRSYLHAVEGKTGGLISLPVEGAALVCARDAEQAHALGAEFGGLGVLFQLQDDILDLYGNKGRGELGCDIREGKVSALVVAHLELHPADRGWLVDLLEAPREQTTADQVDGAIRRFRDGGALARVLEQMRQLAWLAESSPVLRTEPALHAVALELSRLAMDPIRHVRL